MAYMNQERKASIAAALKKIVPAGWKYSLAVRHHSTIVMTIAAAPVDLLADVKWYQDRPQPYTTVSGYHLEHQFSDANRPVLQAILDALNEGNFDKSDLMSDYHHVGWYVDLGIGRWSKPFVCTAPQAREERFECPCCGDDEATPAFGHKTCTACIAEEVDRCRELAEHRAMHA